MKGMSEDDHLVACDVRQFGRMEETFLGWYGKGQSHPVMYHESTEVRINTVWFKNKTAQTSRREIWGYETSVSKDDHLVACDVRQFGRMEEAFLGWYGKGQGHPFMYHESTEVRINTVWFKKKTAQTSRREIWGYERNVSEDDNLLVCDVRKFGRMEETFLGWYGKGQSHPVMYHESTDGRSKYSSTHNLCTRKGLAVSAMTQPLYPQEGDPVPIVQAAGWVLGLIW